MKELSGLAPEGADASHAVAERLCLLEAGEGNPAVWLTRSPVRIANGDEPARPLPAGAVARVFERYGLPFDEAAVAGGEAPTEELRVESGWLRRLRHRTWYDVLPRDYLVYQPDQGVARYQLCSHVSAALLHLAERYAASQGD
ncbi:MAG: hypothetical protein KF915_03325 [Polyangiaceae bacterium]|nr:hypothetical protein [Polyangiaceae bacterium]